MILLGSVEPGKHLGRTLGFPTANIKPEEILGEWPANGVYAAAVWVGGSERAWLCMLNQGVHPTAPEGKPTIEAHILDFAGDLYGQEVRVEYLRFLRPERRFASLGALVDQLQRDREDVRAWLRDALDDRIDSPEAGRARAIRWREA